MQSSAINVAKIKWLHVPAAIIEAKNAIDTYGMSIDNFLPKPSVIVIWKNDLTVQREKKSNQRKIDYYKEVWYYTEKNANKLHNISLRGQEYHIDHIVPISYGFKKGIDPKKIGGIKNLRVVSKQENFRKSSRFTAL